MSKHPVAWFYILTFSISWLGWIPVAIGSRGVAPFNNRAFQFLLLLPAVGPALAAFVVTKVTRSAASTLDLLKALTHWRVGLVWYIVALFGPIVLLATGKVITKLLGFPVPVTEPKGNPLLLAISALTVSVFSNPWEEIGWRGFALPRLQKRYNALAATLIVGILWGLWHLPLFFWVGNPMSERPFLPWLISTVAEAFVYTWLYNSTKGSVLLTALFHVMLNTFGVIVSGVSTMALTILNSLMAVALVLTFGSTNLSHQERTCAA